MIRQPETELATTPVVTPVRCYGENSGVIALATTGGNLPYRYSIDQGTTFQTDSLFTSLVAGTYTMVTIDSKGCGFSMEAVVTQPELLEIAFASKSDILCYGEATGAITVSSAGGTLPYRYSLDGQSWQDMADFTNLLAGKYQVLLQDARGCQAMLEISLVQPEQPLALSFQVTPVQCKETTTGAIKTAVSGGTSPYVYQWESLADKNPESFPDGQYSAADVSGLPDGDYVLTVTDAHGCQLRDTIAVTEPEIALQASITIQRNVSCFGLSDGFVQIEALGGYPPYRYAWQGREFLDTLAYDDLAEGHYQMLVKDTMNCQVTIEVYISQPDVLAVSAEVLQHVSCFAGSDASFVAKVTGGTQSYRYSLDAGMTFQPEPIFAGYPKGIYNILVEDALGCTVSTQINITEPVLLSASIDKVVPSACTQANGEALIIAQGGTPPYRYAWINQPGKHWLLTWRVVTCCSLASVRLSMNSGGHYRKAFTASL